MTRPALVRAILNAVLAFSFMIFAGWYSGQDMLSRGLEQVMILFCAVMMSASVFIISAPASFLFLDRE